MFFLVNVYGVCQGICNRYTCEKLAVCKIQKGRVWNQNFVTKLFKTQSVQIVADMFLQLELNLFLITQAWTKIIHLEKTMLELKNVSYN